MRNKDEMKGQMEHVKGNVKERVGWDIFTLNGILTPPESR